KASTSPACITVCARRKRRLLPRLGTSHTAPLLMASLRADLDRPVSAASTSTAIWPALAGVISTLAGKRCGADSEVTLFTALGHLPRATRETWKSGPESRSCRILPGSAPDNGERHWPPGAALPPAPNDHGHRGSFGW